MINLYIYSPMAMKYCIYNKKEILNSASTRTQDKDNNAIIKFDLDRYQNISNMITYLQKDLY